MHRGDWRLGSEIGPDYRKVMDEIRSRITSGEYPVGSQIPSTGDLRAATGLSITSVRRAVQQLEADGILKGHPGKGVFVLAVPEDADRDKADLKVLAGQVADLAELVKGYGDLRAKVNLMEAVLMNLCARQGIEYPRGGAHDNTEKAPRRKRAGR